MLGPGCGTGSSSPSSTRKGCRADEALGLRHEDIAAEREVSIAARDDLVLRGSVSPPKLFPAVLLVGLGGREPVGEGDPNAFKAGFHRVAHLVLPVPVGSRDRVTR